MRYEASVQNLGKLVESFRSFCNQTLEFSKVALEVASKGREKEYLVDGKRKKIKDAVELRIAQGKVRISSYEDDITSITVNTGFWTVYVYSSLKKTLLEVKVLKHEKEDALSTFSFQVRRVDFPITFLKKEAEVYGIGVKNEEVFKRLHGIQNYSQALEKLFMSCDFREVYELCQNLVKAYVETWEEKASTELASFWRRFVNSQLTEAYLSFLERKEAEAVGTVENGHNRLKYSWTINDGGMLLSLYKGSKPATWRISASLDKVDAELFPEVDKAIEEEFKNGIGSLISQEVKKQSKA